MSLRALFHALILSHFRHEVGRTLLTVVGLSLGVAVLVAIDLANEAAVVSFKDTVNNVAGRAEVTVRGNGAGLPGEAVGKMASFDEVESVAPLIQGYGFYLPNDDQTTTETLLVLGVDILRTEEHGEDPVREFSFEIAEGYGLADFLVRDDVLIFTKLFANRLNMNAGDSLTMELAGKQRQITIGALIDGGTLIDTYDGNVAVGDVAVIDALFRRQGLLDRLDITLRPGTDRDAFRERLRGNLPPQYLVEWPEERGSQVDQMVAAFRFNLRALGHLSILVGAFIIFNTMSVAVVRRRPSIGTVRALGITSHQIRTVFLLEGALLGLLGSTLGIALGLVMASLMMSQVSDAISINFFPSNATSVPLSWSIILMAMVVGIGSSTLAALAPAQEAASTPPANTMRRGSTETSKLPRWAGPVLGLMMAVVASIILSMEFGTGLPIPGYIASLLIIGTFVLWSRPVMRLLAASLRAPYSRFFGAEGLLAVSSLTASIRRTTIAICGLMISLGMAVSVSVMIASFRGTVISWMEQVLVADVYIQPASAGGSAKPEPFPYRFAEETEKIPGILAVDPFRRRKITINGQEANLGAGRIDVVQFKNTTIDGRPLMEAMRDAKAKDQLVISEAFARKHGFAQGDFIPVPTPQGIVELQVGAVYYDYSSEQGYATMDRELYLRYFDDPQIDTMAVYLKPTADSQEVARAIKDLAASMTDVPALSVRTNRDLRGFALEAFDRTFSITYVLQVIAILVSVLGVATTLLAQLLDRRHEIATLRYLGATRFRILKIVALETSLIGIAGTVLGISSGLILSYVLTTNIMLQSFGWTIGYTVPWWTVIQIGLVVFVGTLLAAVVPAREATRFSTRSAQTSVS